MKVVIIGSGNVATVLSRSIKKAGHEILQIIGRDEAHAKILADEMQCGFATINQLIDQTADIYLFALADTALYGLDAIFHLGNKIAVHTAGSVHKNVLKNVADNYGVVYPLQSLRKEISTIPEIPLLIDGNTNETLATLAKFAASISPTVHKATDEQREKLHLAAVAVNNFTNYLFALASDYCKSEGVDFKLLFPLIEETVQRIHFHHPHEMQTGPASRNDTVTISNHLKLLEAHPKLKHIYQAMTDSILHP